MDSDIEFSKEQLYWKLNSNIKKQTNNFMKQIESKIVDFRESQEEDSPEREKPITPASTFSLSARSGSEGLIRVLQAKIKVLREQLNTLQSDYTKRTGEWKSLQGELVRCEESCLKTKQNLISSQEKIKKQEKLIATITGHLQVRDKETCILRKQIESLKRELKQQELTSDGNEVRLNRNFEEIERLKEANKRLEFNEKDLKDMSRMKDEELNKTLARIEKQKLELISSFKKQLHLINNLKKQQSVLETCCLTSITEEEFIKLLDWSPPPTVVFMK